MSLQHRQHRQPPIAAGAEPRSAQVLEHFWHLINKENVLVCVNILIAYFNRNMFFRLLLTHAHMLKHTYIQTHAHTLMH